MANDQNNFAPLNYAVTVPKRSRTFAWPVFISSAMMVAYLELLVLILVPHMRSLYQSFHLEIPASTVLLLNLSAMMIPFGCLGLAIIPFMLGGLVPRLWAAPQTLEESAAITRKTRRVARLIYFAMFFLILGMMYALLAPMVGLIQALTTPSK